MVAPLVLPLAQCHDASLAGGKGVGLPRVLKGGADRNPSEAHLRWVTTFAKPGSRARSWRG